MQKAQDAETQNTVEKNSFIITAKNGKKLEVINELNPSYWILYEYEIRKSNLYNEKTRFMLLEIFIIAVCLMFNWSMSLLKIKGFFRLLCLGTVILLFNLYEWLNFSYKSFAEFETNMKSGKYNADMERSIKAYFSSSWDVSENTVYEFLYLKHDSVYDIEIIREDKRITLKIMLDGETGDIFERTYVFLPLYNSRIEYPQIIIYPSGIRLKVPMDMNKTGEADSQA